MKIFHKIVKHKKNNSIEILFKKKISVSYLHLGRRLVIQKRAIKIDHNKGKILLADKCFFKALSMRFHLEFPLKITTSTLRFRARFSSESFGATGATSANPAIASRS